MEVLREYAELMQMIKKSRLYRVRDILRAYIMDSIRIEVFPKPKAGKENY